MKYKIAVLTWIWFGEDFDSETVDWRYWEARLNTYSILKIHSIVVYFNGPKTYSQRIFVMFKMFIIIRMLFTKNCTCSYLSLNFQACLHIGHCWVKTCEFSHLTMQCMWKQWVQAPQTSGQSSPGRVHSVQQLSKGIRQMPQLSSFAIQRQVATAVQSVCTEVRDKLRWDEMRWVHRCGDG